MNYQKLVIYDFNELFIILNEIKNELNFQILNISKNNLSNEQSETKSEHLIITKKLIPNISNQVLIEKLPIKISKLIESINIQFLRKNFNKQSEINIAKYKINLNSRELMNENKKIKLTEKEVSIILYLSKYKLPKKIEELQSEVWGYQPELETHTVETHIYRLRQKILKEFNDDSFIISKKNGYQII